MKSFAAIATILASISAVAADIPQAPSSSDMLLTLHPLEARQSTADACTDGNQACSVGGVRWVCGGGHWIYAEVCNTEDCCDVLPSGDGIYCSCGGHQ